MPSFDEVVASFNAMQHYLFNIQKNLFYTQALVGDYKYSARTSDFNGWLFCDGRVREIDAYPELYEIIGTSFGHDGEGTFRLPDFRGRVPGIVGTGSNLTTRTLGTAVGTETHTLTVNEMPGHTHTGITNNDGAHTHTTNSTTNLGMVTKNGIYTPSGVDNDGGEINTNSITQLDVYSNNSAHQHNFTTNSTGNGAAHPNMQPTQFGGGIFIYAGLKLNP